MLRRVIIASKTSIRSSLSINLRDPHAHLARLAVIPGIVGYSSQAARSKLRRRIAIKRCLETRLAQFRAFGFHQGHTLQQSRLELSAQRRRTRQYYPVDRSNLINLLDAIYDRAALERHAAHILAGSGIGIKPLDRHR